MTCPIFHGCIHGIVLFSALFGAAPLLAQPACRSCPFPPCPCPCTIDEIAAVILSTVTDALEPSAIFNSGSGQLILRRNQILYVYQYTPAGASTAVTTYLPIKQFGSTDLYFYRLPQPSQPMGGWQPVRFTDPSDGSLVPFWESYFKCNRLPRLSGSEINDITQLFLPDCCCPPCD